MPDPQKTYKNGSMSISKTEQGMFKSNFVMTSGWSTPSLPMFCPRTMMSAHCPGKKAVSAKTFRNLTADTTAKQF